MPAATYGDLIDAAERDLISARRSRTGVTDYAGILGQLQRIVAALALQLDLATPPASVVGITGQPAPRRAAAEIREALCLASDQIGNASRQADKPSTRRVKVPSHCVSQLSAASEGLFAAYDLVRTHQIPDGDGIFTDRSDWAAVARSAPAASAIVLEAGRLSASVDGWLRWLTSNLEAAAKLPRTALDSVNAAGRWLDSASKIAARVKTHSGTTDLELLRGVPLWHIPDPVQLSPGEAPADLCAGITAGAGRLRAIAFDLPGKAACSSPEISGPAWQKTCQSAAVVADLCAGTLAKLAQRLDTLAMPTVPADSITKAIAKVADSCASWRQAADMWRIITTDTQTAVTPATAELNALMLRLGRLSHTGRDWTLGSRSSSTWLTPSALAPDQTAFVRTLAAVHEAADALARLASADLAAFDIVSRARRFYMPNKILWDDRSPTRNYAYAPHDRIQLLRDVHQVIVTTSRTAAEAIDDLARHTQAPTRLLAVARLALAAEARPADDGLDLAALQPRLSFFTRPRHVRIPDTPTTYAEAQRQGDAHPAHNADEPSAPAPSNYGHIEARIRAASVTDPGILVRAAALDRAGNELVRTAAQLAAQDRPNDPADPKARPAQAHKRERQSTTSRRAASR